MAQFSVKPDSAKLSVSEEKRIARELRSLESDIRSISNSLGFQLAAKANIQNRLRGAANRISAHQGGMSSMHSALQNVINSYERIENMIAGNTAVETAKIQEAPGIGYEGSGYGESILEKIKMYLNQTLEMIDDGKYRDFIMGRIDGIKEFLAKVYEGDVDFSMIGLLLGLPGIIQGDISEFNSFVDNIKDTIIDKTSFDKSFKTDGALWQGQISCANGSLGASVLAYEAYADAKGGLMTKDKDGNLIFNPNIDAKMGASFTALEAAGAYSVGDDWFGADASGNITVGKVSGEASISAGLRGEDGSFDPHAKLDASAEAILIDAKAQAGVTCLGTKAEVEAGVNVGIGAHANVEIGDGKIACDIGASLGIGASIKFTIDYGGTVDAVKKAAKGMAESVWNKIKFW